jgi:ribosomal protein S25
VTDFLDEKRAEITSRLKELRPLVDEFNRLEAAAAALAGVIGSAASEATSAASAAAASVTRRRGPGRPRGSAGRKKAAKAAAPAATATAPKAAAPKAAAKPAKRRAGRRKGSGTRAAEARSFVQGQPGITIPELAAKMGIKQNYLYRVLPGLEQENKVEKKGRGWYPKS